MQYFISSVISCFHNNFLVFPDMITNKCKEVRGEVLL